MILPSFDHSWIMYIPEWYLKEKHPQIPIPTDIRNMLHYRNPDRIKKSDASPTLVLLFVIIVGYTYLSVFMF